MTLECRETQRLAVTPQIAPAAHLRNQWRCDAGSNSQNNDATARSASEYHRWLSDAGENIEIQRRVQICQNVF